jgi:hypothetical protein
VVQHPQLDVAGRSLARGCSAPHTALGGVNPKMPPGVWAFDLQIRTRDRLSDASHVSRCSTTGLLVGIGRDGSQSSLLRERRFRVALACSRSDRPAFRDVPFCYYRCNSGLRPTAPILSATHAPVVPRGSRFAAAELLLDVVYRDSQTRWVQNRKQSESASLWWR